MLHPGHSSGDALEGAVPESLLYEHPQERGPAGRSPLDILPPRPDETGPSARWEDEQAELQRQRDLLARKSLLNPRDWAMWRWANVHTNLDNFLQQVYGYYDGNGIWSILLSRTLSVLTLAFVTGFSTYLGACIDYSKVRGSHSLEEIKIDKCMAKLSSTSVTVLALLTMFWCFKIAQYLADVKALWDMHKIYKHLLDIDEEDMQTISWNEVVNRLVALRDQNPVTSTTVRRQEQNTERMDAHDIANRIMRKENYLVALFNKEILNLSAPLPFLSGRPLLTRTLEWNLSLCILAYVFDENGQVRPAFVKDGAHRKQLIDGLRRRFLFAGIMNAIFAPFIIIYLLLLYFFKYFSEYHKNPGALGSRAYTPYAQWKFREFNEVQHLFQRRLNLSQLHADRYVSQFPNDKTMQTARFVSFVAGSFAAVLALASVIDPDLFLGFEITHDRTVLFYISLFGTIMAVARSMVPDETLVFDPEASLREVVQHTHYTPPHWDGNFHSHAVKAEFCRLYDYKVVIFLREILSVLVTPVILWFSLPDCSERIIDFVREYTIHVDGIGFVCTFAVFDFSK
ncbi:APG9-domain-containing protein, partial [Protomyces lactucae-debilis]